jgi:hypothetical protein
LTGLKLRWLEDPLTIATPPLDHTGVVALKGQAKNLETVIPESGAFREADGYPDAGMTEFPAISAVSG